MSGNKLDEILDFAIEREQEAHDFYVDLAEKAKQSSMKEVFAGFASEELGHKHKIQAIKEGKRDFAPTKAVMDLKISNYVVDVEPDGDLDYQHTLILAMKREKAAFKLYKDMAAACRDQDLKQVLLGLAQEEAKHKLHFEIEYDDQELRHN